MEPFEVEVVADDVAPASPPPAPVRRWPVLLGVLAASWMVVSAVALVVIAVELGRIGRAEERQDCAARAEAVLAINQRFEPDGRPSQLTYQEAVVACYDLELPPD